MLISFTPDVFLPITEMGITKAEALKAVDRERGPVCEASDRIWDQPETAFQEFHSTNVLCELLEKEGFRVREILRGSRPRFPVPTDQESR